jgi:16S rRNA (guanine(527)-N(7))-methyltransferase RsmG
MECAEGLKRLLGEFGISSESYGARQLLGYLELLEKWNARINLTAAREWAALEPLFREGIWASRLYPVEAHTHLDIGSGAGFPAIPLQILVPGVRMEMVESRAKRSAFLETVIHALGMESCVHTERLDRFLSHCQGGGIWDCISWKGVKLLTRDVFELRLHAHPQTQFWIFHGRELAVEEPEAFESSFEPLWSKKLPGRKQWSLSAFLKR